jgi:alkylmercury lyase
LTTGVDIAPDGIERLEPADAVVSLVVPELAGHIRRVFCHHVHFFSSREPAAPWLRRHPGAFILPVATAF